MSNNEIADIMSDVLGKPIRFRQIPSADYKAQLLNSGASEAMAQGLVDMQADIEERGVYRTDARRPENSMPTTFRVWCEEVLKPAVVQDGEGMVT